MPGKIYLLDDENSELTSMEETQYDSEFLLQHLLAKHPDLLAGDQMNSDEPRRWLLVTREMSVPDTEGGSKRWSVDHLFLDQDAIPTLVEVKRSTDTRIRRVVEFLNEQMDPAEVLAVEVKRFVGEGVATLVPRVLGQTDTALRKKSPPGEGRTEISEQEFLDAVQAQCSAEEIPLFE